MKIGLVYTSTTPELIDTVEHEVRQAVGEGAELISMSDSSIIAEIRETGYVTAGPAARLIGMYTQAALQGCDAVLNLCSSVGEVADSAQGIARFLGMPIVRIDEEMCREAVRLGETIAVMATLQTTLEPTKNTIRRVAREMGRHVTLVDCLVEGAFGLNPEQFKVRMKESAMRDHARCRRDFVCTGLHGILRSVHSRAGAKARAVKSPVRRAGAEGSAALQRSAVGKRYG